MTYDQLQTFLYHLLKPSDFRPARCNRAQVDRVTGEIVLERLDGRIRRLPPHRLLLESWGPQEHLQRLADEIFAALEPERPRFRRYRKGAKAA